VLALRGKADKRMEEIAILLSIVSSVLTIVVALIQLKKTK